MACPAAFGDRNCGDEASVGVARACLPVARAAMARRREGVPAARLPLLRARLWEERPVLWFVLRLMLRPRGAGDTTTLLLLLLLLLVVVVVVFCGWCSAARRRVAFLERLRERLGSAFSLAVHAFRLRTALPDWLRRLEGVSGAVSEASALCDTDAAVAAASGVAW